MPAKPAYPGCSGKEAVKRVSSVTIYSSLFTLMVETIQQYNRKYKKRKNTLINYKQTR